MLVLSADDANFHAFERPDTETRFMARGDSLAGPRGSYAMNGQGTTGSLTPLKASQEFWHRWRTVHPATDRY